MRYLMRDAAPLTESQWERIDKAVVDEASRILVGRRLLDIEIAGARTQTVPLDQMGCIPGASMDYWARGDSDVINVETRRYAELVTIYADFAISWRDIEDENSAGVQAARDAAVLAARREDHLLFYGDAERGIEGLFSAKGINEYAISDWNEGENAVRDLAASLEILIDKGCSGDRALVVSTDLYAKLHRIQPGTGLMEVDRVRALVGKLFRSSRLKKNSACLVYNDPQNMDMVVGQDMITAYMGNEKLDHAFRVMETLIPRIKRPYAIVALR